MDKIIDQITMIRKGVLNMIDGLSAGQLNEIPAGFNNNIIWNAAHLIIVQQNFCYFRSGLAMPEGSEYFEAFKSGTKPERPLSAEEIEHIKTALISSIDQFKADYHKGMFTDYQSFTNRFGIEINTIEDALYYIPFHEGMHCGYIMALKKVISKNI